MNWDKSYDVVVVGSGGAALAGAMAAVARGLTTCVIEKTSLFGGTSAYSGGSVWLPGNHILARDGVDDSIEKGLTYFTSVVGDRTSPQVQRAYVETGPELVEFLEAAGIPMEHRPFPDYFDAPGRSANGRTIFAKSISAQELGSRLADVRPMVAQDQFGADLDRTVLDGGQAWIARMVQALDNSDKSELRLETAAQHLVQDDAGRVVGVQVATGAGSENLHARAGVLLAAGGFERSAEMRTSHQQIPTADWTSSHPTTGGGDALRMVQEVGAAVDLLDQSWWCPATLFPNGHAVFTLGVRAGIVVDTTGERFANEMLPYDQMGRAMGGRMEQGVGDAFWFIFDNRFGDELPAICMPMPEQAAFEEAGLWHTATTVDDLASKLGLDAATLVRTVDRFNNQARNGRDEDFRRGEDPFGQFFVGAGSPGPCLLPLDGSRFHAVRLVLGDLGTKGGAVIDLDGAVMRDDGSTIAGLYAAGNSSASISGAAYPAPGVPLGSGMVMAYRATAVMAGAVPAATAAAATPG